MIGADPVLLVSPHLLVAQAMAVALVAAGTPAVARTWQSSISDPAPSDREVRETRRLVVILDGFEHPALMDEVVRLVQTSEVRILLVTSLGTATWCGRLLEDERVDLATSVASVDRLAEVVDEFMAGGAILDPEGRELVAAAWHRERESRSRVESLLETLSPQQGRVLQLLADGRGIAEIGTVLGVTSGTVRSHVKSLRAKLGAHSQLEAVAMLRKAQDAAGVGRAEGTGSGDVALPRPRPASDGSGARTRR